MWLIANTLKQPLHKELIYTKDYPHTISYCCKKQIQIDSFMELSKEKRPPKCLHPDTKVFVKRNNLVSHISLNTLFNKRELLGKYRILSYDGWKKIIGMRKTQLLSFMEISVGSVSTISCSLDHRFPTSRRGSYSKRIQLKVAENIKPSKESKYCKDYFLHKTIKDFLPNKLSSLYSLDLNYELGYLLGIYLAEGGLWFWTTRITMNSAERFILEKLSHTALNIGAKRIRVFRNDSDKTSVLRLKFSSKPFTRLAKLLCPGNVYTKRLNLDIVLNTPEEFRQGIFDGYIQGDGAKKQCGSLTFISASKDLRDTVIILASSVGRLFSQHSYNTFDKRYNKIRHSHIAWSRDGGKKRRHRLIYGNTQLPTKSIKHIETPTEFIDIEVEDGIFLIESGILSHNSMWHNPEKLEDWFDRVFDRKQKTHLDVIIDEVE